MIPSKLSPRMIEALRRLAKGPADAHYGTGYATGRALSRRGLAEAKGSDYWITERGRTYLRQLDTKETLR